MMSVNRIQAAIEEVNTAIENLWHALEQGQSVQRITDRIHMREAEKKELQKQLIKEQQKNVQYDYLHILAYIDYLLSSTSADNQIRNDLINMFVESVYLFDDHYTIFFIGDDSCLTLEQSV